MNTLKTPALLVTTATLLAFGAHSLDAAASFQRNANRISLQIGFGGDKGADVPTRPQAFPTQEPKGYPSRPAEGSKVPPAKLEAPAAKLAGIPSTSVESGARPEASAAKEVSDPEVRTLVEKARAGDIPSQMRLAQMYAKGIQLKRDTREAVRWWTRAAEQGATEAMFLLGLVAEGLADLPPNASKAVEWYEKAAGLGHIQSINNLGFLYLSGRLMPKSGAKAAQWYQKSAALGDPGAQSTLAAMLWEGEEIPRNKTEARRLYQAAAEKGYGPACNDWGLICLQDDAKPYDARRWFEKGVEAGHLECAYNLGKMLEAGEGGGKDLGGAVRLYAAAATGGHGKAMNNYGCILGEGTLVPRDLVEACKWFLIADRLGVQSAAPNFQLFGSHLTEGGRNVSRRRAEEFLNRLAQQ